MTIKTTFIFAAAALSLSACAQKSSDISATYVSPLTYQSYSCEQLGAEAQRVSQQAVAASSAQDQQASSDAATTAVSLVLFWPALFFIDGDDENAAQLARLKGEMEAIEQANIQKNCGLMLVR